MFQRVTCVCAVIILLADFSLQSSPQSPSVLDLFFRQNVGLSQAQIAAIGSGQAVTKILPSRTPGEVFLFGAIHIQAAPERYVQFSRDFERLRQLPGYLALGVFSNPPQPSDLNGFSFDGDDIQALKSCKPGDCLIQMPADSIEDFHRSINWSAAGVSEEVNQRLRRGALQRLSAYQREGNPALGIYNDKPDPTEVPQQFAYLLSYSKVLPERLPEFYQYLLAYPKARPANVEDTFYWANVKFGLKPTLRVVQKIIMRGGPTDPVAYAVAEKQLYSSHYFETALELSFCVRGTDDARKPGFYLIMVMGSEQAGLTGAKGAIVKKVAAGRSVANLQDALTTIRDTLESTY